VSQYLSKQQFQVVPAVGVYPSKTIRPDLRIIRTYKVEVQNKVLGHYLRKKVLPTFRTHRSVPYFKKTEKIIFFEFHVT
jgi:hypothetical protein